MFRVEGVGEFGTLLADSMRRKEDNVADVSVKLRIDKGSVYHHIGKQTVPTFQLLSKYSGYLDMPIDDLIDLLYKDWGNDPRFANRFNHFKIQSTAKGDFGKMLAEFIMKKYHSLLLASDNIGVTCTTIKNHICMKTRPSDLVLRVYSEHLEEPFEKLSNMVCKDWYYVKEKQYEHNN